MVLDPHRQDLPRGTQGQREEDGQLVCRKVSQDLDPSLSARGVTVGAGVGRGRGLVYSSWTPPRPQSPFPSRPVVLRRGVPVETRRLSTG